jgi:hypothetical protein
MATRSYFAVITEQFLNFVNPAAIAIRYRSHEADAHTIVKVILNRAAARDSPLPPESPSEVHLVRVMQRHYTVL